MNARDHAKAAQHWMEMAARADLDGRRSQRRKVSAYQQVAGTHALIALALVAVAGGDGYPGGAGDE